MLNTPKIPREELQFKKQEFMLSVFEQYQESSKIWFFVLLAVAVLAIPLSLLLLNTFSKSFISSYDPPHVNEVPYVAQDLKIFKAHIIAVEEKNYSIAAQISNPNIDISAKKINYTFVLKSKSSKELRRISGETYLFAGENKFVLLPLVELIEAPGSAELVLDEVSWTKRIPTFEVKMEILQKNSGVTSEGNFFVEGLLKNLQDFQIRRVDLEVLVYDAGGKSILAMNSTVLNDLKSFESRYFRLIWPKAFEKIGQIEVVPSVNPFEPGLILNPSDKIPAR